MILIDKNTVPQAFSKNTLVGSISRSGHHYPEWVVILKKENENENE